MKREIGKWWIVAVITGAKEFPGEFTRAIEEMGVSYCYLSRAVGGFHCYRGRKRMRAVQASLMRGLMSQRLRHLNSNLSKWPGFIPRVLHCSRQMDLLTGLEQVEEH